MNDSVSSYGYESTTGEHGEKLYLVGDEYVTEAEATAYARAEADALASMGDPGAREDAITDCETRRGI
jgi:hypothetical protein